MTTALIVDDEAPMREQLRARLREVWPELEIVGEASNGLDAVTSTSDLKPDIVFLDIRMPGQSGIEAAKVISRQARVVFATAYDEYAVEAFERGAFDYLLKPVTADRLATTVQRLKARLNKAPVDIAAQLRELTAAVQKSEGTPKQYMRWIQAQVGNSLRMISTREILFFQSDEKYTRVQTETSEVLIRKTLKELEDELDPSEFWRIHRSTLVRVDAIAEVTRDARGRQLVVLRGHPEKLEISRGHTHLFQQM